MRTEGEVSKLIPSLDVVALLHRGVYAPNHHRTDTHAHDAAKLRAVDRHDLTDILAVYIQRRSDSLRLIRAKDSVRARRKLVVS